MVCSDSRPLWRFGLALWFVLWVLQADTLCAEPQRLTFDGVLKMAAGFADRGEGVVFSTHEEPTRVSMMRLSLSDGHLEPVDSALTAHQWDATVSADGRYLCFVLTYTSPQSILVIRDTQQGTEARFIPTDPRGTVRCPQISAHQQRVIFSVSDPGGQQIASVDLAGGNLQRLTDSPGNNLWPAISPDSSHIAFSSSREGPLNLYVMHADGSHVRRLTSQPLRDMRPAWSPSGKQIAFTSARDGNPEIYVVNADGTGLRRLTSHPDRDDYPAWHPDGRRLLIISERAGDSDLYLLDVPEE